MLITVVTVCYQAESTIAETIDSVVAQLDHHPEVEHLVIDGLSTDGTREIVKDRSHEQLRWISEEDDGLYDALNKGIAEARGEVVGFLHADDVLAHQRVLHHVAKAFSEGGPGLDACYGDLEYVDASSPTRVVRDWRSCDFQPGMFRTGWMPPHPTFYARKRVYEKHGGFDLRFQIGADWDLMLRLFEVGEIRTRYLSEVLVRMRTGGLSNRSLGNIVRNNWECLSAFRKYGMTVPLSYFSDKLLHRLRQFRMG
ncbi:MAG: glycosyltransferase family 2 protein [Verrucomicrobiota bacterium]